MKIPTGTDSRLIRRNIRRYILAPAGAALSALATLLIAASYPLWKLVRFWLDAPAPRPERALGGWRLKPVVRRLSATPRWGGAGEEDSGPETASDIAPMARARRAMFARLVLGGVLGTAFIWLPPAPAGAHGGSDPLNVVEVSKVDSKDPVAVGEAFSYQGIVTNTGGVATVDIRVTDTLPAVISATSVSAGCSLSGSQVVCTFEDVPAGNARNFSINVVALRAGGNTTPQNHVDASAFTNAGACCTGPELGSDGFDHSTTIQAPDLQLTKNHSQSPVPVQQPFDYTLRVTHTGATGILTGIRVTDTLPAAVQFASVQAPAGGSCFGSTGSQTVTCTVADLTANQTASIVITVTPTTAGTVTNFATATFTDQASLDPTLPNTDSETTVISPSADVTIQKKDLKDPVLEGERIDYVITVTNSGPSGASTITVTDTIPSGTTFDSASPECALVSTGTVRCTVTGTFGPGASDSVTISVIPSITGLVTNRATATGISSPTAGDPNTANNSVAETTRILAAGILLVKSGSPNPVGVSETLTYLLEVFNGTTSTATAVVVTDTVPSGTVFSGASPGCVPGGAPVSGVTCTVTDVPSAGVAQVTVTVTPTVTGTVTNTASATATAFADPGVGDADLSDNVATATVLVVARAELGVSKTAAPNSLTAGSNLSFTIRVANAGPSTATAVRVTDTLPAGTTFLGHSASPQPANCSGLTTTIIVCTVTGSVAPGTTETVTINARAGNVGTFNNVARASSVERDTNPSDNVSTATYVVLSSSGGGGGGGSTTTPTGTTVRLGGADRIDTAIRISQDSFPTTGSANDVELARQDQFPDALAGTPRALKGTGPILLTPSGSLDSRTKAEIQRVLPSGRPVYILGGTAAISQAVEDEIRAMGFAVTRLGGIDRIDTAVKISQNLYPSNGSAGALILSRHDQFPDALAGGPLSKKVDGPILLTPTNALDSRAKAEIQRVLPAGRTVYVLGGEAAISAGVASEVQTMGYTISRLGGADRYETARRIAEQFTSPTSVGVARGDQFPDALAGGAHAGRLNAPVVLTETNTLRTTTKTYLEANRNSIDKAYIYGGTDAISNSVETQVGTAIT